MNGSLIKVKDGRQKFHGQYLKKRLFLIYGSLFECCKIYGKKVVCSATILRLQDISSIY